MIGLDLDTKEVDIKNFLLQPSTYYQVAPSDKNITGRPVFDGKNENEVVAKLQFAFSVDASVKEACYFADISTDSFYRYCKKYPEFRNKIELLRSTLPFLAKVGIYNAIVNQNLKVIKWYLERRCPEDYSPRVAVAYELRKALKRIDYLQQLLIKNNIDFNFY